MAIPSLISIGTLGPILVHYGHTGSDIIGLLCPHTGSDIGSNNMATQGPILFIVLLTVGTIVIKN